MLWEGFFFLFRKGAIYGLSVKINAVERKNGLKEAADVPQRREKGQLSFSEIQIWLENEITLFMQFNF